MAPRRIVVGSFAELRATYEADFVAGAVRYTEVILEGAENARVLRRAFALRDQIARPEFAEWRSARPYGGHPVLDVLTTIVLWPVSAAARVLHVGLRPRAALELHALCAASGPGLFEAC